MNKTFDEIMEEIKNQLPDKQQTIGADPLVLLKNQQVNLLLNVFQKLSLARDLETVMFIVRKAARQIANSDGATFVLRDGDKCYYADEDAIEPLWKGKRFPMEMCISGWVILNKESVVIEDIYVDERIPADAYRPTFVKSLAMVPIRTAAPIGAIGTYWSEKHRPTPDQLNLLKALADSTSIAIENINLLAKLESGEKESFKQKQTNNEIIESNKKLETTLAELNRRNDEMIGIKELSSKLQACLFIDEAYHLIAQYAEKLLPNTSGMFYSMQPSHHYLDSDASWGSPFANETIIKPIECIALRRGSANLVKNTNKDLTCNHYNKNGRSYACFPLFAQSDIIGLLYIEWNNGEFNDNQTMLASTLAEQIALGISNIKLRESLRNQSLRDTLTNLYNRRYLDETLERELSRCERKSMPLAIMMLDVDHFKHFNDKYGHEAGDIVLQALAKVLRDYARKSDIACRYGGEEFIFILPEVDGPTALERAHELHDKVSQIHLQYGAQTLSQITISIGIAVFPTHGRVIQDLIAASDKTLYKAKKAGRNTTIMYELP